jgi:hypothetical protein
MKEECVDAMVSKQYAPGEVIIQEGDKNGDYFYLIDSGEFEVVIKGTLVAGCPWLYSHCTPTALLHSYTLLLFKVR